MAGLVILFILIISVPLTADAQARCRKNYASKRYNTRGNYRSVNRYAYNDNRRRYYYTYERPNFYRRHRNLINLGIGTGGGSLISTAMGARSGALYTYVLNPKKRRYVRR